MGPTYAPIVGASIKDVRELAAATVDHTREVTTALTVYRIYRAINNTERGRRSACVNRPAGRARRPD
ncbi:MAG: hypothetical protein ACR2MN_06760 [Acidimicrobiales bacterium]